MLNAQADDDRRGTPGDSILAAVQHGDRDEAVRPSPDARRGAGAWRIALGLLCLGMVTAAALALRSMEGSVPQRGASAVATPAPGKAGARVAVAAPSLPSAEAAAPAAAVIEAAPVVPASKPLAVGEAQTPPAVAAVASTGAGRHVRHTRLAAVDAAPSDAARSRHPIGATELDPDAELVAALIARLDRRGAEPARLRSSGSPRPLPPASAPLPAAP